MIITYETHDIEKPFNAMMVMGCFTVCCVNVGRGSTED